MTLAFRLFSIAAALAMVGLTLVWIGVLRPAI